MVGVCGTSGEQFGRILAARSIILECARGPQRSDHPWLDSLRESSVALQAVLQALLDAESQFSPPASPLQRLHHITNDPEWAWLQPLYRLIADTGLRQRFA
jgi:hypothetical protein